MELEFHHASLEQARNAAIAWLEDRGATFGPHRSVVIGRLGVLQEREVGVESNAGTYWRLRLDFDPTKGAHYNAEFGKGNARQKAAFRFPGGEAVLERRYWSLAPR